MLIYRDSGFIRGPGDCPKPITFSFHDKLRQGPLLSVVRSHKFHDLSCISIVLRESLHKLELSRNTLDNL